MMNMGNPNRTHRLDKERCCCTKHKKCKGRQAVRLLLLEDRISDPGAVHRCMHALSYGHVGTGAAKLLPCALHSPLSTAAMLKVRMMRSTEPAQPLLPRLPNRVEQGRPFRMTTLLIGIVCNG
jgi:hypothetical protein